MPIRQVRAQVLFLHISSPKTCPGAQGFIARESVTLGNLTVANQALGESLFCAECGVSHMLLRMVRRVFLERAFPDVTNYV